MGTTFFKIRKWETRCFLSLFSPSGGGRDISSSSRRFLTIVIVLFIALLFPIILRRVPLGAQPTNVGKTTTIKGSIKSALKTTSSLFRHGTKPTKHSSGPTVLQHQKSLKNNNNNNNNNVIRINGGGGGGGDGAENEHPQQGQQRRVSFQAGRPPVHKEGARLAQLRAARQAAQKAGGTLAAGKWGNTTAAFQRNQFGGRRGSGSQMEEAQQRASRMEQLRKRKGTGRRVKPRPFVLVVKAPESLRRAAKDLPEGKKRRTAMVVEELDAMNTNKAEGEHSAAASRDGDRAGSFAENNTDEGFAGYDFNGNRTAQPMFRPKSPHAKQRKFSVEMNSQLRMLREQHMQEGGVLAEAIEEERMKKEQMELEKQREMLRRKSVGGSGEVTNTPMAAEALVNMFNIPGRGDDVPPLASQDSPDWQGVSHMAGGQSQPQVQPVLNENLNNDDDEFGAGFEAGGDDEFDQEDAGGQFADDRAFDEEGFPIRKPRGEAHKRLREEMARRKSLAFGGLQTIVVEDLGGGQQKVRKSSRQRQKPLEYWRGEKKVYERVHGSLPTIKATQRQTRNKMWPRKTPGGPSETFRVLKLRPTEQFNKMGAERRDSLDKLMTDRNGAPLHDSDDEEEIWDVESVEFDQHGRRIKTFAKTPREYYGRNGRATPNYNNNVLNNNNNNGSGKKKRGRPRKNPPIVREGAQEEQEQEEHIRGKHIRLAPDTDDEDEENEERDAELEENTRRNSEAIVNNVDDEKNNGDEDEEEEDAEAAREANEAARAAEIELEEEREEEARKALKAKQELETQEMEAKIAREEIQEEEEELEEDEETRALKQRLADAEAEHATLDALDKANEEAIAMLNRHDEKDDNKGEDSLEEVDEDGNEVTGKTSQFSMSLEANKGMFYDEEADKELIEDDPAIKSGSINLEDLDDDEDDNDEDEDANAKRDSLSSKSEEENNHQDNAALAIPMELDE